jgi:hypothetical protein
MHFQSNIVESSKVSPLFTRVKIRVAYDGENRNGSFISKETFEKAASYTQYCPIVGEWSDKDQDFQGHGGKIEIKDSEVRFIRTTVPYGCIGSEPPTWETIVDDNGNEKEYFTLIGYIWTSRYPELNSIIEDGFRFHSMEVDINSGEFQSINGKKLFVIEDMFFSAFCILGLSTEPCFENSTISTYTLDAQRFKNEFKQLLAELKYTLQHDLKTGLEGGNDVEENKEIVQEEFEVKDEQPSEEVFEQEDKSADEEEMPMHDEHHEEMAAEEQPEKEPEGDEQGEDTDNDGDGKDEKYELLESELSQLKESFSLLETELKELREYKAQKLHEEKEIAINAVFESVSTELTEDELAPFKEKAFEMEVDALKKELYALIGQKAFEAKSQFSAKPNKSMSIALDIVPETTIANSYDAIIKKYNQK